MWATFRGLTRLRLVTANRHREAKTFRAGSPIRDRHCASIANESPRRSSPVLYEKQLRFQFLARARKHGAGEADRTLSAIVWRYQTVRPGGRTHLASTHQPCANIALDFSAPARAQAGTAETFPRNQLSARVRRAVKRRSPPCAGYGNKPRVRFAFITRSTPVAMADMRCEILCAFARRIT